MQISAANLSMPSSRIESTPSVSSSGGAVDTPQDPISLKRVAALLAILENKPEVRPEVVARGRALAADAGYPPPDIINKLAGLIISDVR